MSDQNTTQTLIFTSQPAHPYYGVWTDWLYGPVRGATLTTSRNYSGLLTAFIALLVSAATGGLWKILVYIAYHLRAQRDRRDGLYHQQQNLIRNSASPSGALIELLHLTWAWRRHAERALLRSLPMGLSALLCLVLFTLAGIFSSIAIKAPGTDTLTRSSSCGQWMVNASADNVLNLVNILNITSDAVNYASICYTSEPDSFRCQVYTQPTLPFTTDTNPPCPFASEMCYSSDAVAGIVAYELDTGKLDSNIHLGINARPKDRITYQRITTCAPINTTGFTTIEQLNNPDGTNNSDTLIERVYLGGLYSANGTDNSTYVYNNNTGTYVRGYTLVALPDTLFDPIPALNRTDADVSIFLLSGNAVQYVNPVRDIWFLTAASPAFESGATDNGYTSAQLVSVLGCAEQHQICNPTNEQCTDLSRLSAMLTQINNIGLNTPQNAIANFLLGEFFYDEMGAIVYYLGATALQAQQLASQGIQLNLPSNQWAIEVTSWFTFGLARLQQAPINYAAGSPGTSIYGTYIIPGDPNLCTNQKARSTSETASFSVLGTSVVTAVCIVLILVSLVLDQVMNFIQERWNRGGYRHRQWLLDGKLQLQRLAYENARIGTWIKVEDNIPVTTLGDLFGMPDESDRGDPTEDPAVMADKNISFTAVGEKQVQVE
ncbi:hypothetical protein L207DRAFT_458517 [Hyaloscypha variabilis F]|uniref:Uncharacterized protein n=1 Tax=Hyaloscypha variabilis (strain UAMH 11265 / GT02V1 / F) TaxID=1149755 RepID=A0A2J6RTQ9_HYAVF|nr:hypothetical protein L207DRAFT_458517 [Hyaloscypha variabilis F]